MLEIRHMGIYKVVDLFEFHVIEHVRKGKDISVRLYIFDSFTWHSIFDLENSACRVWSFGRTRNKVTLKLSWNFPDLSLEAWK